MILDGLHLQEQSEQYAVTIAAMEDKLLALMKKLQLLEKRNEHVEQQRACHQQVIYTNSGMEKGGGTNVYTV